MSAQADFGWRRKAWSSAQGSRGSERDAEIDQVGVGHKFVALIGGELSAVELVEDAPPHPPGQKGKDRTGPTYELLVARCLRCGPGSHPADCLCTVRAG